MKAWRALAWFAGAALVVTAPAASAQGAPAIEVQAEADTVGVGDTAHVQMVARSAEDTPSSPSLGAAPGFAVGPPSESTSQMVQIINGSRSDQYTLTVEWGLRAQRVGTYSVGPFSAVVHGARFAGRTITLHVVPAGQAPSPSPRQQQQQQPSPFGFSFPQLPGFPGWGGMPSPRMEPEPEEPEALPATDPKWSLDVPRGAGLFFHATLDKPSAVIGEPVLYSVYAYTDVTIGGWQLDPNSVHEAAVPDFVKQPLTKDDQDEPILGYASVGGRTWAVQLILRWALFPLRAGDLAIGPMSVAVVRPRGIAGGRSTEALVVHVSEPPMAGRPPGYVVGDAGRFALSAQVQPRQVEQGGAVSVHVELTGTGNLPSTLVPPMRDGIEWLTPVTHDQVGPVGQSAYGGKRSFDFVAYVKRPGAFDLGAFVLPFWDPDRKKYDVARADLGSVQVTPLAGAASTTASATTEQPLDGLPSVRDRLEGRPSARRHADDGAAFWWIGVLGGPVAFCGFVAGRAGARRVSRMWRGRHTSPLAELKQRLAVAERACDAEDPRAAHAAIAHAVEAAIVAHTGVNVRGALGHEIAERLERARVSHEAAEEIALLLGECEAARFAPEADDMSSAQERWARARASVRHLEQRT